MCSVQNRSLFGIVSRGLGAKNTKKILIFQILEPKTMKIIANLWFSQVHAEASFRRRGLNQNVFRAPRRNFPDKPSLHRRLPPGCYGCSSSGKYRFSIFFGAFAIDSRALLRTVACPARALNVFIAKSRGPLIHGPDVAEIPNLDTNPQSEPKSVEIPIQCHPRFHFCKVEIHGSRGALHTRSTKK